MERNGRSSARHARSTAVNTDQRRRDPEDRTGTHEYGLGTLQTRLVRRVLAVVVCAA